jgi:hypothetical protein
MLGFYENFPQNIHKISRFATSISTKKLQQTLVETFTEMNGGTYNLEDVAEPPMHEYTVIIELGIADTNSFSYLDSTEKDKALTILQKTTLPVMDFYCSLRYYRTENEKKTPLRFDYYMIRFAFNKNYIETQIFHERGPRYVSPEDINAFFVAKINGKFSKKMLKSI